MFHGGSGVTVTSEAIGDLFYAKMMEAVGELSVRKFDSLAMVQALGMAFLTAAAACAPDRAEYERVVTAILAQSSEIWDRGHPH
jgi:hypothetical protein